MAFDETIIKPWGLFLLGISKEVENEELRDIKLVLGDKLTARDRDSISDPVDLLELLERKRLISEDDTALLRDLFREADKKELILRLNEYEANRKKYLETVTMLAGSQESRWLHLHITDDGNQVHWDFLTDSPQELTLQDNEAEISCGIRFSPSRAKLGKPLKVTLDYDAHFFNPRRAEIFFYTRKKDMETIRTTAAAMAAAAPATFPPMHAGPQAAAAVAATFPPMHADAQAATATFSSMHAGAQAAGVSTLSQNNLESDRKLDKLSKHVPTGSYTMLCTYLGIDYNEAKQKLRGVNNDYQEATRDCLAQWKTRTGGNMDKLETILQNADLGDLVKYIK